VARPESVLIVPVLSAEPVVAAWLGRQGVHFGGAPLHVTVMYPFLPARSVGPEVEQQVADLAREVEPFGFVLARLGRFPGVWYLAPEPASPFLEITGRIQRRWPQCLPYRGAYPVVVPHVTVALGDHPPADPAALARRLPVTATADELWLLEAARRGWRLRRRFPLGPGAAAPGGCHDREGPAPAGG
jgi:2'-5' RNA ligase